MKYETFKNGLAFLMTCFPKRDFEPKTYWHFWKELNDDDYMKAVNEVCSNEKDIYPDTNMVAMIKQKAKVKPRLTAGEGWECVRNALRACGERDNPNFKDPLVAKVVRIMGWKQIFNAEITAIERSNFIKMYNELAERGEKEDVLSLPAGDNKQIGEVNKLISGVADGLIDKARV